MQLNAQHLFAYKRTLPSPYDTLAGKSVPVASKYTTGATNATLSPSVIKAIHAICNYKQGAALGAVGIIDHRSVIEYKSSIGDEYHLAVYDPTTGDIAAGVFDTGTDVMVQYSFTKDSRDGTAVLVSLFPTLYGDDEFKENFDKYLEFFQNSLPDLDEAAKVMGMLCDNIYRRINDESCPAHVKLKIDKAGNLSRIGKTQIDAGKFTPTSVIAGAFSIFSKTGAARVIQSAKSIPHSDFIGHYTLNPGRKLTLQEQTLVPVLEPWYIIPDEVVGICKHTVQSTAKNLPMRNFLLRGPAGTGKTAGARAIAAGLKLPYVKFTCSANTELFDLVGQVFPDTAAASTGNADLDHEREMLQSMGGINYENVAKLMALPELDDIAYDPEGVYLALSGKEHSSASIQDCVAIVLDRVSEKIRQLSQVKTQEKGQSYIYVETDFIRALKNGWLIEVQEPATIMQPGVLVGLNSLLEQSGSITLPTGEIIHRHPDSVVVITTNVSYEGCRTINQSVVDRMSLVQDIALPSAEVMVERAMHVTGCEDDYLVSQMVEVVRDMAEYCRINGITDGNCGMRSLIDWVISTEITQDPYTSALYTVVSKATTDEEDREALIQTILDQKFTPKRLKSAV